MFLKDFPIPKTYIHYINDSFLDKDYKIISKAEAYKILFNKKDFVVKQTIGTSGGEGVRVFESISKNELKELLDNPFGHNLLFQERIKQCDLFNSFSSSSVNTIRIYTYWYKDEVYTSNAVLRIGLNGSKTDNSSGGGLSFQIDDNDKFVLIPRNILGVIDNDYLKNNNIKYHNEKLLFMEEVRNIVKEAAERLAHFKIISWDIAIDKNYKPIIIEYNVANTIPDITQIGAKPFFGDNTDNILKEVFNNKRINKEGLITNQYI